MFVSLVFFSPFFCFLPILCFLFVCLSIYFSLLLFPLFWGSSIGVTVKVLEWVIEVSEFELEPLEKARTLLYPPVLDWIVHFFYKDGFDIKLPSKVDMPLNEENQTKPSLFFVSIFVIFSLWIHSLHFCLFLFDFLTCLSLWILFLLTLSLSITAVFFSFLFFVFPSLTFTFSPSSLFSFFFFFFLSIYLFSFHSPFIVYFFHFEFSLCILCLLSTSFFVCIPSLFSFFAFFWGGVCCFNPLSA